MSVFLPLLAFGLAQPALQAQSFLQISSVRARPTQLTCVGPGARTRVRVQIYIGGLSEEARQGTATVNLAIYSAHPSQSTLAIDQSDKEVALSQSPALVDFDVACTPETVPGTIALAATISKAPESVGVKEPMEAPVVQLRIQPVQ